MICRVRALLDFFITSHASSIFPCVQAIVWSPCIISIIPPSPGYISSDTFHEPRLPSPTLGKQDFTSSSPTDNMSNPAFSSPTYKNESIGWRLITTDYVTVIAAFVLVFARLYTKYFLTKSPGWEDGTFLPFHASSPCPGADDACNSHVRYCLASCHRSFRCRLSRYAHL